MDSFSLFSQSSPEFSDTPHGRAGEDVSRLIAQRIGNREGIVTAENCREVADGFFDYLAEFPYETLFD